MSLNVDSAQSTPIKNLRDTRVSQSLILANTRPFSEKTSSGIRILIQSEECGFVNVPLHNIYLSSDLVTGPAFSEKTSAGTSILIQDEECGLVNVSLHKFSF